MNGDAHFPKSTRTTNTGPFASSIRRGGLDPALSGSGSRKSRPAKGSSRKSRSARSGSERSGSKAVDQLYSLTRTNPVPAWGMEAPQATRNTQKNDVGPAEGGSLSGEITVLAQDPSHVW